MIIVRVPTKILIPTWDAEYQSYNKQNPDCSGAGAHRTLERTLMMFAARPVLLVFFSTSLYSVDATGRGNSCRRFSFMSAQLDGSTAAKKNNVPKFHVSLDLLLFIVTYLYSLFSCLGISDLNYQLR